MLLYAYIAISSVWRAFYFPPNARDILSGPEAIAEYAVKEHSLINSVLTLDLSTTNNHLKPPFITDLQIVYKMAGFAFGQVWLSVIFLGFMLVLYGLLKERVHRLLAGLLLLLFLAIPEMFSYTFITLFDYTNMVLFFLGFYFMWQYFEHGRGSYFSLAVVLMGFATWVRSETLVLVAMTLPALWVYSFKHKTGLIKPVLQSVAMMLVSYCFYAVWINVFLKFYMPGGFSLEGQINKNWSNVQIFFTRLEEMNTRVIFGDLRLALWNHYFTIFLLFFASEIVFGIVKRKLPGREYRNWLYGAMVVYFGLPLLGYLIPLVDLMNTTKRGLFKIMPFLLMLMACSSVLQLLSNVIIKWEEGLPESAGGKTQTEGAKARVAPIPATATTGAQAAKPKEGGKRR
jgi:hypothetical protein